MQNENTNDKIEVDKISISIENRIEKIVAEFKGGFESLEKLPKSVSIFGSSRSTPQSPHYRDAQELASRIIKETGYAIITGGGPGIMAAANLGAQEAEGKSIGFNIELVDREHTNPYTNSHVDFKYFFIRKTMLTFAADIFVFFPGGFGTFDELFSILTLIQTKKIPRIPIILVGKDFWNSLLEFIKSNMLNKHHVIQNSDLDLFFVTDNLDKVIDSINKIEMTRWWEKVE